MEKLKTVLNYVGALVLPPLCLAVFITILSLIVTFGFKEIGKNIKSDQQTNQQVQTIKKAGKKVWTNFEKWANE